MGYCTICDKNFSDIDLHIDTYHSSKPEEAGSNKEGVGDFTCPLCNVRVKNRMRHYSGALHRFNVLKNAVYIKSTLEDYKAHHDAHSEEKVFKVMNTVAEEGHFFWMSAKQELSQEDYEQLKEYVNGKEGKQKSRVRRYRR